MLRLSEKASRLPDAAISASVEPSLVRVAYESAIDRFGISTFILSNVGLVTCRELRVRSLAKPGRLYLGEGARPDQDPARVAVQLHVSGSDLTRWPDCV